MNVVFVTTWNTACGIATYSENLIKPLKALGINVEVFSMTENYSELTKFAKLVDCDLVHFQHEFGLLPDTTAFLSVIAKIKSRGIKVVVTTHTEADPFNIMLDGCADAIILHNDDKHLEGKKTFSRFIKIPHGIPEISFKETKAFYRKKYNIPEDMFVIGTCGFLAKKGITDMVSALIPFMSQHKDVYMNLITSAHSKDVNKAFATATRDGIMNVAKQNGFEDRIAVGLDFTPPDEFREHIYTLDLGFAYASPDIKSNSGAAADIVSCGVPVISNDALHFSHIRDFIEVTPHQTTEAVATSLEYIYRDYKRSPDILEKMAIKAKGVTETLGYSKVAKRHFDLYIVLLNDSAVSRESHALPILDKSQPITLNIVNSLWQVLALWPKLYSHIASNFKIKLVAQNDGMTDLSILQFVLAGIESITFGDIRMTKDPYLFKVVSKNVAQKMDMDLEYFLKRNSYDSLFPDSGVRLDFPIHLGSFAEKQALKLGGDVDYIINLTPAILPELSEIIEGLPMSKKVAVMTAPINAHLIDGVRELFSNYPGYVKYVVEDTRTRWAMCKGLAKVFTAFDDVAIFSALNIHTSPHNGYYVVEEPWQADLLKAFNVDSNCVKFVGKGVTTCQS